MIKLRLFDLAVSAINGKVFLLAKVFSVFVFCFFVLYMLT